MLRIKKGYNLEGLENLGFSKSEKGYYFHSDGKTLVIVKSEGKGRGFIYVSPIEQNMIDEKGRVYKMKAFIPDIVLRLFQLGIVESKIYPAEEERDTVLLKASLDFKGVDLELDDEFVKEKLKGALIKQIKPIFTKTAYADGGAKYTATLKVVKTLEV